MKVLMTCLGLFAILWMGCSKKQDQEISAEEMLSEQKDSAKAPETPPPPPPPKVEEEAYHPKISKDGPYVVQISVYANRGGANRLAQRLNGEGYPAYVAEVESPTSDLSGTFYRVRVAGFDGVSLAREFGHKVIEKMGYEFWVDNKSNDNAGGQPSYTPASSGSSSSYPTSSESSYPKVQETPTQTPAATYEPPPATPATAPTSDWGNSASTPAPAAEPAPAAPAPEATAPAPAPAAPAPSTPAQAPAGGTGGDWDWGSKTDSTKARDSSGAKPSDGKAKSEWDF